MMCVSLRDVEVKALSPDLKVASLIRGQFGPAVEDFLIVDCRYPYEYQGGHIKVLRL